MCIHSHAVYATMFAVAHQDIPSCIDEFTVYLGGDIRCTEYARAARPNWPSRWSRPSRTAAPRSSPTTAWWPIGTTMEKTMHNTALVERSAKIIWGAKQLGGIFPLPEKVNENFMSVYPYMR